MGKPELVTVEQAKGVITGYGGRVREGRLLGRAPAGMWECAGSCLGDDELLIYLPDGKAFDGRCEIAGKMLLDDFLRRHGVKLPFG